MKRIACLLLALVLCVQALAQLKGESGPYRVSATTEPAVIPVGKAQLRVTVTDSAGKPLDELTVRALASMPGMDMGEREVRATPIPNLPGGYAAPAIFSMAGAYEIAIRIDGPPGPGTVTLKASTGQSTAPKTGPNWIGWLPWLAGALFLAFVLLKVARSGQRLEAKSVLNRSVIGGLLLLAAILALSIYAVNNWRRKGAMTPIEAQAMEMNTPAPPGFVPVRLAIAKEGDVRRTVRYSGQAVGFAEVDVVPRVTGQLVWMPLYVGDRVVKGQVIARLDTTQLDPQLAERQAMVAERAQGVDVAATEFRQMLEEANEARSDLGARRAMRDEAAAMVEAAQQERQEAATEAQGMQAGIAGAEAEVSAAEAAATYQRADLGRMKALFDRGAVSRDELQKAQAMAAESEAEVRKSRAMLAEAKSKAAGAQAGVRRADAMAAAARRKVAQAQAEIAAAQNKIRSREAAAEVARQKIAQEQASVRVAQAGAKSAAAARAYAEIRSPMDGVVTVRSVSPGTLVSPGQTLLRLAQTQPIRLQANVPEADLPLVAVGSTVQVSRRTGKPVQATVTSVAPSVDPTARTGVVEAVLANKDRLFRPGEVVSLQIQVSSTRGLSVPSGAIQRDPSAVGDQTTYVWVAEKNEGETTVRRVTVEVAEDDGKVALVSSGLKAGQAVVAQGGTNLREGDLVVSLDETAEAEGLRVEVGTSYTPSELETKVGEPTKITFVRTSDEGCGEIIVFPDYGIRKDLPLNVPVVIEFTPKKSGIVRFTCGMDMMRGQVVVR